MILKTEHLELRLQSPDETLEWVASLPDDVRCEISEEWQARLRMATGPDPWACSFKVFLPKLDVAIGSCGFKGPPDPVQVVEIAYGIDEPFRTKGYATESAQALLDFATTRSDVSSVIAHTKAEGIASERILTKLGFALQGTVDDPDDGLVNRWLKILRQ